MSLPSDPVVQELVKTNALLLAVLTELQSWKGPAEVGCPHTEEMQVNLSSMGERWIRCKGCGTDLVREQVK